jgi:hypothetical protein
VGAVAPAGQRGLQAVPGRAHDHAGRSTASSRYAPRTWSAHGLFVEQSLVRLWNGGEWLSCVAIPPPKIPRSSRLGPCGEPPGTRGTGTPRTPPRETLNPRARPATALSALLMAYLSSARDETLYFFLYSRNHKLHQPLVRLPQLSSALCSACPRSSRKRRRPHTAAAPLVSLSRHPLASPRLLAISVAPSANLPPLQRLTFACAHTLQGRGGGMEATEPNQILSFGLAGCGVIKNAHLCSTGATRRLARASRAVASNHGRRHGRCRCYDLRRAQGLLHRS